MKSQDAFRLNVKDLMGRQGLKVKDLADMVGLSPSYLSLILSGERANLSDLHKDAIALALGVTVAELYMPPLRLETAQASPAARYEPGLLARTVRDITPFEDLLRSLNAEDHLLLEAFYRELNSLSDEEVRKMGTMLRNALASWQKATANPASAGAGAAGPVLTLEPDDRALLWLLTRLSSLFGDVPLAYLGTATSWPDEKLYRVLGGLESAGVAVTVSTVPVLLRPSRSGFDAASLAVPASRRREFLLALARGLDAQAGTGDSLPGPDRLAELFLEGGDLPKARFWFEQSAIAALAGGMWRVAKDRLLVVSSLDNFLGTPAGERVSTVQMLATTCLNLGETEEALAYQERGIAHWERTGSKGNLVLALMMAGSILARRREWGKAVECLDRALGVSSGDDTMEAKVRLGLAAILSDRGQLTRTREEYERALALAGNSRDESIMAQSLLGLGRVFFWRRDFKRALQHLNRALSLVEKKEAALEVLVRVEIGRIRFEEGSFLIAQEHLSKASLAAEAMKTPGSGSLAKAWLSRCLGRGGVPADLEPKRDLARSARDFLAGTGDRQGLVVSLVACAEAEEALNSPASADALFEDALREARDSGNPALEGMACDAFAEYLERRGDEIAPVMRERARWARARIR